MLIIGDVSVELVVKTEYIPENGGSADADSFDYMPGGRGTSSSVSMARLGADAVLCSAMGDDSYGKELAEYFSSETVDTRFFAKKRGESTATELVLKDFSGAERRICYSGAINKFADGDIEEAFISYPDAVLLHGNLPERIIDVTTEQAYKQLPLFIASLPDPSKYPLSRIKECEILVVNEDEAYRCSGIRPSDQEKCMRICIALSQRVKAKYVIIRLGERGAFLYDGTFYSFISAYDVPTPKGISSDDAYTSALVYEYLRTEGDIKRACDFASIVSAIYLSRGGGLRAYPSSEDVKKFVFRNEIDYKVGE